MYMISRMGRLSSLAGLEWAEKIGAAAGTSLGVPVNAWTTSLSPAFGTVVWTSFWTDLAAMEGAFARLADDPAYLSLAATATEHLAEGVDDTLWKILNPPTEAATGEPRYVGTVQAVLAPGRAVSGAAAGLALCEKYAAVTGSTLFFAQRLTGTFGGVEWFASYATLGDYQSAQEKLAADPTWAEAMDAGASNFSPDAGATHAVLWQRVL
jgi:hypothetical protein